MTDVGTTTTTQSNKQLDAWLSNTSCLSWAQVTDASALALDVSGAPIWVEIAKDGAVLSRRVRAIELEDGERRNVLGSVEAYSINLDAVT